MEFAGAHVIDRPQRGDGAAGRRPGHGGAGQSHAGLIVTHHRRLAGAEHQQVQGVAAPAAFADHVPQIGKGDDLIAGDDEAAVRAAVEGGVGG